MHFLKEVSVIKALIDKEFVVSLPPEIYSSFMIATNITTRLSAKVLV